MQAEMKRHKPPPVKIPVAARSAVTAEEPSQRVADNSELKTMAGSWISMCPLLTPGSHLPLAGVCSPPRTTGQGCAGRWGSWCSAEGEVLTGFGPREDSRMLVSHLIWANVAENAARGFEVRCSVELSRLWACET